jgi:hypothetical protein
MAAFNHFDTERFLQRASPNAVIRGKAGSPRQSLRRSRRRIFGGDT